MRLYHATTPEAATQIVDHGFRDASDAYGISQETTGVFLSDVPLDANEGTEGDTLLLVDLTLSEEEIAQYEWTGEEWKKYREWQIPAKLVNEHASIKVASDDEADREYERGYELLRTRA